MITVTDDDFTERVLRSPRPVLVEFWADWCGPCRMLEPVLKEIEAELGDRLTIARINADDHPEISARHGVLGLPTLTLYRDGEVVGKVTGAKPKRLLLAELEGHI
ncbi:thioredoxin-1 [Streptosporangium violaceochromogenes]|nr:thioredoxin-1 [Streptosporangium violaceochromogenes]